MTSILGKLMHKKSSENAVLVVDDESDIRKLLSVHLQHIGCDAYNAGSSKEAMDLVSDRDIRFRLFIIDINMAGETGIELTKQIRERARYKTTPVIILTGVMTEDGLIRIEQEIPHVIGMAKPFDARKLKELVLEILQPPEDESSPNGASSSNSQTE